MSAVRPKNKIPAAVGTGVTLPAEMRSPHRGVLPGILCHALRWTAGGARYSLLEILCRGYTHWSMAVLAAVLCVPLDLTNNYLPWDWPLWLQAGIGGLIITAAELVAGLVLNVWLGLSIWDYTGQWGNLWGQICPRFTVLWCMLAGAVIILFDWLDYLTGDGKRPRYKIL